MCIRTISTIALTFLAPLFARLATLFTPADYFALMVLALVALVVPYLPALVKRLRGERPDQGRMIFGGATKIRQGHRPCATSG
jgi:hypothetical protein